MFSSVNCSNASAYNATPGYDYPPAASDWSSSQFSSTSGAGSMPPADLSGASLAATQYASDTQSPPTAYYGSDATTSQFASSMSDPNQVA